MIPFSANVADIAVNIDALLSRFLETGSTDASTIRKLGRELLKAGGNDALLAAAQLIVARNCASATKNQRVDILQECWAGIAKREARNRSLNDWRQRKKHGVMLVKVEISAAMRHTLVDLGLLQRSELGNKVEIGRAIAEAFEELAEYLSK